MVKIMKLDLVALRFAVVICLLGWAFTSIRLCQERHEIRKMHGLKITGGMK